MTAYLLSSYGKEKCEHYWIESLAVMSDLEINSDIKTAVEQAAHIQCGNESKPVLGRNESHDMNPQ